MGGWSLGGGWMVPGVVGGWSLGGGWVVPGWWVDGPWVVGGWSLGGGCLDQPLIVAIYLCVYII